MQKKKKKLNYGEKMKLSVPGKEHHFVEDSCDQLLGVFQIQFDFDLRWLPLLNSWNVLLLFLFLLCVEELNGAWLEKR